VGRDQNVICVITDNNDVAEARDVLDGVVAVDRADVPAVSQRRSLSPRQSSDVSGMTTGAVRWCIVRRPVQVVPRDPVRDAF